MRCSSPGCKRAHKREYMRQWQRDYAAEHGEWRNAQNRQAKRTVWSCAGCGKALRYGRNGPDSRCRSCSAKHRVAEGRRTTRRRAAERKLELAIEGCGPGLVLVEGPCRACGGRFVGLATPTGTCSATCLRRLHRRRLRAAGRHKKGAGYVVAEIRLELYKRDDWTCQLCGEPVDRDVHWNEPRAPSLDHVLPKSLGGSDEPENLRTAHRHCNSVRGARIDDLELEQASSS